MSQASLLMACAEGKTGGLDRPVQRLVAAMLVAGVVLCSQAAGFGFRPSNGSDDFTAYVSDALALVRGTPYGMPGYILNKHYDAADSGQGAYPPGYPLVLAPVVAGAADPVRAAAVANCVFYALFAGALALFAMPMTGFAGGVAAGLLAGMSPIFLNQGTMRVPSESLYLLAMMAAFLSERMLWTDGARRPGVQSALTVGVLIAWASLIRVTGVLLGPAAILADVYRRRRLAWPVVLASAAAAALFAAIVLGVARDYVVQNLGVLGTEPGSGPVSSPVGEQARVVLHNLLAMPANLTALATFAGRSPSFGPSVGNEMTALFRRAWTVVFLALAAIGFVSQLRRRVTMAETYAVLQTLLLLNFTPLLQSPRYWLPVSALALVYSIAGVRFIFDKQSVRARSLLVPAFSAGMTLCMMMDPLMAALTTSDRYSLVEPRARDALAKLSQLTPDDAVIVARRPRTIVFYAHRKAADYDVAPTDPRFWRWAGSIGATHLLLSTDQPDVAEVARERGLPNDDAGLRAALQAYEALFFGDQRSRFELVFNNTRYHLFRIVPSPG